jgi:uncharacterized protein with ATP-grasp and redox domains
MHTYLDCIPCLFKQGLSAARFSGADESVQRRVLEAIAGKIPELSLKRSPPEVALSIHNVIKEEIGSRDPYYIIKKRSNAEAMHLYPALEEKVNNSKDPLRMAVELAIAGNLIDYGARTDLDLETELETIFKREESVIDTQEARLFALETFKTALSDAETLLIIGDNAGEIVFDKLLLQVIRNAYPDIGMQYGVREKPVINDVTMEDALDTDLDSFARIVSTGCETPGAVLSLCSPEFVNLFKEADVIISKGQGNFEALSEEGRRTNGKLFFLFSVKCPVIAAAVSKLVGDSALVGDAALVEGN